MKMIRYLLLFFLLCIYGYANCQSGNLKFEHPGGNSGISNANVSSIIQDSRGFMWFGTFDGLNKYDGYQYTVYRNNPSNGNSLSNNSIKSIIEDMKRVIWVGTWGGGLNKFDREKNKFIHFKNNPRDTNSISSDFITCLLEDKEGNLWIGTGNGGLDLLNRKNNQFSHYKGAGNNYVTTIFEDGRHNLWMGTVNGGLFLVDKKNKTFENYQHNDKDSNSLCNNDVYAIFEDSRQNLWIGTNDEGLDMMDKKTGGFSHFKKNLLTGNGFFDYGILVITEDTKGNFWIGTRNGGLNIFNPQTGVSHNYHHDDFDNTSLARNTIPCIYEDRKKDTWISTVAAGLNFVNGAGSEFIHYNHNSSKNSLSDNNVTSIYEDVNNNLWIGTDGGGLNMFNSKLDSFIHYRHQANNKNSICGDNILSICGDSNGNLWIGTWGAGITVFNQKKNTFRQFKNDPAKSSSLNNNNVWTIFEDREKNMWIGTYGGGLNLYNPAGDTFTHYTYDAKNPTGINNDNILTIFEDHKGLLWIGTDGGGLNEFDTKTNSFIHYIHNDSVNSLSYNFVSDIFEDKAGNLYIASGNGLNYFNTVTHHFTVYTANDDFNYQTTFAMMQDDNGNLWISRAKGISCFDPLTKNFINFNTEDGLHLNEYNSRAYCKSRSGMMYFGGNNGFDEFFPGNVKKVSFDPPLVITDFRIFNKEVPVAIDENDPSPLKQDIAETRKIIIPYSSSVISFEFASLHYGVNDRKQYEYMLKGFDKTWNDAGPNRIATYTNLDPGNYVFEVKGLNNESKWSSDIISIQLTITPPYWLTWWFKSGVLIIIIGTAFLFYKFRVNLIKAQKRKLEQRVLEQTHLLIKSTKEERTARKEAEQANKDLRRKNKEIEQFAYIASHDLQEPLRTTSSFVALLRKQYQGSFDEKADKYFTFISDASDRMKMLIKNLLDFSSIGNKKELERVDCNELLHDVLADLGVAIRESGAKITYGSLPVINGYALEVKQLFQNLITNAIKFRKKDISPVINISVQKNESYWQFAFKDNGIGIDKKYNEKIFLIFQRLHTRTEYEGSGIGLSHCKKIVELHNGEIWVESIPGEGSTFYFTLSAAQAAISLKTIIHEKKIIL